MKPYNLLFFTALIICFIQVWLPQYYLTGDGATHLYNAKMLNDRWTGNYKEFYSGFYVFNTKIDPNWFSHILLALLLFVAKGAIAEKILISVYIIIFATGFRRLVYIAGGNKYLLATGLLFIFSHTLSKGFYNFNFSIAFFLWLIWAWLNYLEHCNKKTYALFVCIAAVTFITHPLGLLYGILFTAILTVTHSVFSEGSAIEKATLLFKRFLWLACGVLPFIILIVQYSARHESGSIFMFQQGRWEQLFFFNDFVTHTSPEDRISHLIGYSLLIALFALLFIPALRNKINLRYSGAFIFVVVALGIYFFIPEILSGGGMLDMRSRQLFYLSLGIVLLFIDIKPYMGIILGAWFFILFAAISFIRIPVLLKAGSAAGEYISAGTNIKSGSVVLPLSFAHNGKNNNGTLLSDRAWLFQHAAGYLGADKELILLDNYEANTGYFPFIWKTNANPYINLSIPPGTEDQLPNADIPNYELKSGKEIDYIIMWCYDPQHRSTKHVDSFLTFVERNYIKETTSINGRALLYKKRERKH